MKSVLMMVMVCFSSVLAIADELPLEERLRVLILETRADIADQKVVMDSAWSAVVSACESENDVHERMPYSFLELWPAIQRTSEATQYWQQQATILEYLQNLLAHYEAARDGLQTW